MTDRTWRGPVNRGITVILATMCIFALTACGAVIDTVLTIKKDGSGTRTITATLDSESLEKVNGGAGALDELIKEELPKHLDYTGMSDGGDGASVFTFEIPFANPEKYANKVSSILEASGRDSSSAHVVLSDTVFRQGAEVNEEFSSEDLLGWLRTAAQEDGLVDGSSGNLSELGTTKLDLGGEQSEQSHRISYSDVEDRGLDRVAISTSGFGTGAFTRRIDLTFESPKLYSSDPEAFDAYFESAVPSTAELSKPDGTGAEWVVTFSSDSVEEIANMTDQVLSSDGTGFSVAERVDDADPTILRTEIMDVAECTEICRTGIAPDITRVVPDSWSPDEATWSPAEVPGHSDGNGAGSIEFTHGVPFQDVLVSAEVVPGGESTLVLELVMTEEDSDAMGEAFVDAITPELQGASLSTTAGDGAETHRVEFRGSPATISAGVDEYFGRFGGSGEMTVTKTASDLFTTTVWTSLELDVPDTFVGAGERPGVDYMVEMPFGYSASSQSDLPEGASSDGGVVALSADDASQQEFGVHATGVRWTSIIVAGSLVLLLVAAGIIVPIVLLRRRSAQKRAAVAAAESSDAISDQSSEQPVASSPESSGDDE